ncbi:MAG: hypothetical protein SNG02_03795 [Rikenellaceae bacterium]
MRKLRRWVSPVFLIMLVASFTLWYLAKLNHTYTTELEVRVDVEGQGIEVKCVVEGVGTNLFRYKLNRGEEIKVPISELRYEIKEANNILTISPSSLRGVLSVRFSDIKIISIDAKTEELMITPKLQEAIDKIERKR